MRLVGRYIRFVRKCWILLLLQRGRMSEPLQVAIFGSIFLFSGAAIASAFIVWAYDPVDPVRVAKFSATCSMGCFLSILLFLFDGPPAKQAISVWNR